MAMRIDGSRARTPVKSTKPPKNAISSFTQARAANNYKQGMSSGKPANTYGAAPVRRSSGRISPNYGGTGNTKKTYKAQTSGKAPIGYTPGGFDDPNVDWGKIYEIFVKPTLASNKARPSAPKTSTSTGSDGMQSGSPAPATAPKPVTTGTAQANKPSTTTTAKPAVTGTVKGNPAQAVKSFTKTGNRGTFGQFKRLRNQRSPRSGLSVTPEMLRRQAQARLLG